MDDIIQIEDRFYILATSSRTDDRTRVLKHGETFAVFDQHGDVVPIGHGEQGVFHEGTRFLSRLELRLAPWGRAAGAGPAVVGHRPLLLSSTVKDSNDLLTVDLTNPDIPLGGPPDGDAGGGAAGPVLRRGMLHLQRAKFLWQAACYERLRVTHHGLEPVSLMLRLRFDADYADIFEVRGTRREQRGEREEPLVAPAEVVLGYRGLDGVVRRTRLVLDPAPAHTQAGLLAYELELSPQETVQLDLVLQCEREAVPQAARRPLAVTASPDALRAGTSRPAPTDHDRAWRDGLSALERWRAETCEVRTSNRQLDHWLGRSVADLLMLTSETPHGPYPYAGVPWYSTVFGRDGLITARQLLWAWPSLARGVLRYLAANQATSSVPEQDAEPGKILHETRLGEMANLGEVPFGRYYGSVDATPLFLLLAGDTYRRTGDRRLVEALAENLELAVGWLLGPGDPDGDGFVEYARRTASGLLQQGWKDSSDSVFHADGTLAEGPIALCEVQAYAFAALRAAAELLSVLGREARAGELRARAAALQAAFETRFWSEELGTYVLALDGHKRACAVRSSNAGHALFAGIASAERARRLGRGLLAPELFSGWGIRTLATSEARYNPMSYHNGSVWPHDTALVAAGLARYGHKELALRTFTALYEASQHFELHRLPELFCGFPRRPGEGPVRYPVACAPQAWASGAVFMLLEAVLGLELDALRGEVRFQRPCLPAWLDWVQLRGLRVGEATLDLQLERHPHDVGIRVLRREGEVDVVAVK